MMAAAHAPSDAAELRDLVRAACEAGTALRVVGAGSWLDAGRPVRAVRRLDVGALSGIVEYVPGDLTMTARAGSTLAELQAAARDEGQFVPLDPWGGDEGTLGATLATATAGTLTGALGLPRDVVLGATVVSGTGELIRAGGRVVKNVAGFDLVRLMVGAWGTLGVITEATVRLRALPECDETLVIPAPPGHALPEWLALLRAAPAHPLAAELVDPGLARALGLDGGAGAGALLLRIAGNEEAVDAQRAALAMLGDIMPAPSDCWSRLRRADRPEGAVLRLSTAPANLAACWHAAHDLATRVTVAAGELAGGADGRSAADGPAAGEVMPAVAHASVTRGVVRVCLPPLPDAALRAVLGDGVPAGLTRRFERLPAALWPVVAPSAVGDALSRGVRRAFDPRSILNPGILGAEGDVADAGGDRSGDQAVGGAADPAGRDGADPALILPLS